MRRTAPLTIALIVLAPAALLLVPARSAPAAREAPAKEIDPLLVLSGCDGHIREREYHCIRDAKAWAALWRRNRGLTEHDWQNHDYDRWVNGVPMVNFGECMVIAVFKGAGTRAGVRGEWTILEEDALRFRFLAAWRRDPMLPQPPPENPTGNSLPPPHVGANPPRGPVPYDFFVFPRCDRAVIIEEIGISTADQDDPVERARFE